MYFRGLIVVRWLGRNVSLWDIHTSTFRGYLEIAQEGNIICTVLIIFMKF